MSSAEALAEYEERRNRETKGIYDFTCDFARLEPPTPELRSIFQALVHNRDQASQFFGVISGAIPPAQFFSPENIQALIGHTPQQMGAS
jgi:hypothetical protein